MRVLYFISAVSSISSEEPPDPARVILKRTLSIQSVQSTSSSFAERMKVARLFDPSRQKLRVIGRGSCGTVLEVPGTEWAYKKSQDITALWTDVNLTNKVVNSVMLTHLKKIFEGKAIPRVPGCRRFWRPDDPEFWKVNKHRFPTGEQREDAIFLVERIPPLPQSTREELIQLYFDDEKKEEAMDDPENKDCLVRVYLGKRRTEEDKEWGCESLRNFELHLDQIEEIGLDKSELQAEMAIGLAIMHWQAQVDAMDTEFVLGSAAGKPLIPLSIENFQAVEPFSTPDGDFKIPSTHLWIVDFDKASMLITNLYLQSHQMIPIPATV